MLTCWIQPCICAHRCRAVLSLCPCGGDSLRLLRCNLYNRGWPRARLFRSSRLMGKGIVSMKDTAGGGFQKSYDLRATSAANAVSSSSSGCSRPPIVADSEMEESVFRVSWCENGACS